MIPAVRRTWRHPGAPYYFFIKVLVLQTYTTHHVGMKDTAEGIAPGPHFGELTVMSFTGKGNGYRATCRCSCGAEVKVRIRDLVFGFVTACKACSTHRMPRIEPPKGFCEYQDCTSGAQPTIVDEQVFSFAYGSWFCSPECREKEQSRRQWIAMRKFKKILRGTFETALLTEEPPTFGRLKVIGAKENRSHKRGFRTIICRCECGEVVEALLYKLVSKQITGCDTCAPITTKKCSGCFRDLPFEEFHRNKTLSDGYNSRCKKCVGVPASVLRERIAPPEDAKCGYTYCDSGEYPTILANFRNSIIYGEWFCSIQCRDREARLRHRTVKRLNGLWTAD